MRRNPGACHPLKVKFVAIKNNDDFIPISQRNNLEPQPLIGLRFFHAFPKNCSAIDWITRNVTHLAWTVKRNEIGPSAPLAEGVDNVSDPPP